MPGTPELVRVIADDGTCSEEDLPALSDEQLLNMYDWMVFLRHLDQRALNLQRQGRLGTYPPYSGQEACQVGSALALEKTDWLFPSYRETAALIAFGVPPETALATWLGREDLARIPDDVNAFTVSIPIASQIPHAVGAAWAAKLKGEPDCALVYFGDGATSKGDFHEAVNFAAVFDAPVVLLCQNNRYAISVPFHRQTKTETVAEKAAAYGIPGVRVDGQDVLAVYKTVKAALDRARAGDGPTLIEALTYRYGPHTTADDPTRYRSAEELEAWQTKRDPITRFRSFLEKRSLWSEEQEQALQADVKERVAEVVAKLESAPPPDPSNLFTHMYAELPPHLIEQRDALLHELSLKGDN